MLRRVSPVASTACFRPSRIIVAWEFNVRVTFSSITCTNPLKPLDPSHEVLHKTVRSPATTKVVQDPEPEPIDSTTGNVDGPGAGSARQKLYPRPQSLSV